MSEAACCRNPELHKVHFCILKKQGLTGEMAARSTAPAFVCHNCGNRADHADDLCNPSPLPK